MVVLANCNTIEWEASTTLFEMLTAFQQPLVEKGKLGLYVLQTTEENSSDQGITS